MNTPPAAESLTPATELTSKNIVGLKYFDQLLPLLKRLRDDGCARDKAGNRELHFDQYAALVLLYLFNPICSSLRAVQQASELPNVQSRLGCGRAALGSLSEASTIFDPERLIEIIQELGGQLQPLVKDPRLADIHQTITLADATLIAAMPRIMEASVMKRKSGAGMVKWRLHAQFEVERHVPHRIDVRPNGGGEYDERAVLKSAIESDRLYIKDRGYAKFSLFNDIVNKKSSYICRIRDNSNYEIAEERLLTDADRAMQVLSDQIIQIGKDRDEENRPQHPVRLVIIKMKPHTSKGKYKGGSSGTNCDGFLRIVTNLLDVPAEIIALLYAYRWTIEIFFRQFKHLLGCRHLLSHNQNGITIQTYCAIIACLLISLWTGRKPTKRTQEMLCFHMMGWATADDVAAHVAKLKLHDEQEAAKKS
jgi:hypothetical protein